jgi:hypothetical protein
MADIGQTDFSLKPDITTALASMYQKKAMDAQTMKMQESQLETQQQDRMLNVMKMATDLTQGLISHSSNTQLMQGRKALVDLLGTSEDQVPTNTMKSASSKLFPGLTQAPVTQSVSKTPEFQTQLEQTLAKGYPEEYGKAKIKELINSTDKEQIKTVQNSDGTVGYVRVNMETGETKPVQGIQAPAGAMGAVNLTDADRTNKALNAAADAYIRGDALPSQIFSSRTANGQKAIALALEKDPGFNTTDYQVKADMKKDYTTKGTSGKNLVALNTAINHLGRLEETGKQLNNDDLKVWNKFKNSTIRQTGNGKVDRMLADRDAVTSEVARVFQGVGMVTQEERNELRSRISEASSPDQIKQVSEEWINLMAGRLEPLKEAWDTKLSGERPAVPFVTRDAADVLKRKGFDPLTLKRVTPSKSLEEQKADLRKKLGL